jgi:hypothetical protein
MLHVGNIVYLDLHKTGSSTLARFFKREIEGETHAWSKHKAAQDVVKQPGDLWVMSVRNPFDYYVSLWAYGRKSQRGLYRAVDPSMRGALYGNVEPTTFQRWMLDTFEARALAVDGTGQPLNHIGRHVLYAKRLGIGLLSIRYLMLATASPEMPFPESVMSKDTDFNSFLEEHNRVDRFIRLEYLHSDLEAVLADPMVQAKEGAMDRLKRDTPINPSSHGSAEDYYSEHTRRLVTERDSMIVERHYAPFPAVEEVSASRV